MGATMRSACLVALVSLCVSCEKGREGDGAARLHESDAGIDHRIIQSAARPGKAKPEDGGRDEMEREAALREQFTKASFIACNDPDAGLAMMRQIHEESRPGSALQREAQWFIDQLTASNASMNSDGGTDNDGGL